MLTINVISKGDNKFITGTVSGNKFNIPFSEGALNSLKSLSDEFDTLENNNDYNTWVDEVMNLIEHYSNKGGIIETKCSDIFKNSENGRFYMRTNSGAISDIAVPEELVDMILKSIDMDLDPKPIIKAWARLLRNNCPEFSQETIDRFAKYVTKTIVDTEEKQRFMYEFGYTEEAAEIAATYQDVTISKEGQIVCKKYARLITEGWCIDPETNEAKKYDKFPVDKSVDDITGEISYGEPDYGFSEDLTFQPPVQGRGGDAFYCGSKLGHEIRVGEVHKLESWSQVNCNHKVNCVKGLHVGGLSYVASYKSLNCQLLDCLVDPSEIGAICDLSESSDGAIRCKEYYIYGASIGRMKGLYHSSKYAEIKDKEWEEFKAEAIRLSNEKVAKLISRD